jgi:hypothetical protein
MNLAKLFSVIACVSVLTAGPAIAAETGKNKKGTCCEQAAAEGKECTHKCCLTAHKDSKSCEKCNPGKQDLKLKKSSNSEKASSKPKAS